MLQGTSTLTTKGQAVIPKPIRDSLGLKTSDQLRFRLKGATIVVEKVLPLVSLQGSVPAESHSPTDEKKAIRSAVLKKHRSHT